VQGRAGRGFSSRAATPRTTSSIPGVLSDYFGASAGAHVAALAALGRQDQTVRWWLPAGSTCRRQYHREGLVGVYGVYDLGEMWQRYQLRSPRENNVENFPRRGADRRPPAVLDASPISYATVANNQVAGFSQCWERRTIWLIAVLTKR